MAKKNEVAGTSSLVMLFGHDSLVYKVHSVYHQSLKRSANVAIILPSFVQSPSDRTSSKFPSLYDRGVR
jgi:hypothetical protein